MKKTNVKQMDGLCKAGCIVSIVSSGIIILMTIIYGIIFLTSLDSIDTSGTGLSPETMQAAKKVMGGICIVAGLLQLLPLFFSINLLRGKANSNILAGVIALIFSGLIGGILILVGKYTAEPTDANVTQHSTVEV